MIRKKKILLALVILTLAFIFGHSLLDQEMSEKESTIVSEKIIQPVQEMITGKSIVTYSVRGIAHVVEFSILGLELVLLLRDRKIILRLLRATSYCGFVALIDESIQYFSGRAPQVIDIWSDIVGSIVGGLVALLITVAASQIQKID